MALMTLMKGKLAGPGPEGFLLLALAPELNDS